MQEFWALIKKFDIKGLMLLPSTNLYVQMFRYLFVGGISFIADAGALWILVLLSVNKYAAAVVGFIIGLTVNYFLSKKFIFNKEKQKVNNTLEFVIYALIGIIGLGLTELIIFLFTDIAGFYVIISKIIAAAIVLIWNFVARKILLYRREPK